MDQFLIQVFAVIAQIPCGKVTTYGEIAKIAGYPSYGRHVGKVLARLPDGSKLPWHRVINGQGKISLKDEHLVKQRTLLIEEGVEVSNDGKISLKQYRWLP